MVAHRRWQFWIDRGGTFTDCIGLDPTSGILHVAKVLSSDRAPLDAIRAVLGLDHAAPIPECEVRMGTTIATNALLERKGAKTGLVVTRGFGDLLEIGTQARPHIFDLEIRKPETLHSAVLEVDARTDAEGRVLMRPDPSALEEGILALERRGIRSLAIVLLHAYRWPELEREIANIASRMGFAHVSLSHDVDAEIGIVGRGDTTTADAYLTPLIRDYVESLQGELDPSVLRIMQSSGGLTDARRFRGRNAILSGPAAGAVACARVAEESGHTRAIGLDMGGTSTDVSRFDGELERVYETEVAGVRIRAPMMAIHTVAAGGGSICRFDGYRFTVGPESAGARPGPLCYGDPEARELTLSDVNFALGRILPDRFPIPLREEPVFRALDRLVVELEQRGQKRTREDVAEGFFRVANANMAEAIRRVSIACGRDVREYTLVVFGGAGGQHACALARILGMRSILFHPQAGVLSAYGMGLADVTWDGEIDAGRISLDRESDGVLEPLYQQLEHRGLDAIRSEGFSPRDVQLTRRLELRYGGTEMPIVIVDHPGLDRRRAFEDVHQGRFGYRREHHPIEIVAARVEAIGRARVKRRDRARAEDTPQGPIRVDATSIARRLGRLSHGGRAHAGVPILFREDIPSGGQLSGPAIVLEKTGTIVVDPGFDLSMDDEGRIILRDTRETDEREDAADASLDPVRLEIFNNLYMSIAEQMGSVLRRTAVSTNIRERLDFSCAVFDGAGALVANAPHIPVHLGAMGESIRGVLALHPNPAPGDVFVTNDPTRGGSHLPDVTVVTPIHDSRGKLIFFTASRGHHADIGGMTPGSMPPFSSRLDQEGVVLPCLRIVSGGVLDEGSILKALSSGPYPARDPRQNLADLEAQIAANAHGARLLLEMVEKYGIDVVAAYMKHVQDNAASLVRDAIAKLQDGDRSFADTLDDGTPIRVTLRVRGDEMDIDFSGTGGEVSSNLNAPRSVTLAAVIYVLRAMVGRSIPLNGGCLHAVRIHIPAGTVLSPGPGKAVAAGNVETSQRIVDVLLGALGRQSASQGTMNNLTFGDQRFGYYETIAGGVGASEGYNGASAVHTHMTNTRITDPEVLETRFPVRLIEFSIRRESGGRGRYRGGNGVIREIEFLKPMRVSILSERRVTVPFGLFGGLPGARGINLHNGREVKGKASFDVEAGDRVRIETPGGGGYGPP